MWSLAHQRGLISVHSLLLISYSFKTVDLLNWYPHTYRPKSTVEMQRIVQTYWALFTLTAVGGGWRGRPTCYYLREIRQVHTEWHPLDSESFIYKFSYKGLIILDTGIHLPPPFKNNNKKRHNNSGWRVKPILNDFMPRPQHLVETILYRCEDPTPTVEIRLCHLGVKTCRLWALCIRTFWKF